MAAARRARGLDPMTELITSVFAGSAPQIPRCVEEALADLDRARAAAAQQPVERFTAALPR